MTKHAIFVNIDTIFKVCFTKSFNLSVLSKFTKLYVPFFSHNVIAFYLTFPQRYVK